ncbi:multidrug resistance protein CDR2, partial [Candida albicans P76067]
PYTVSFFMQVRYVIARNFLRMKGDPSIPLISILSQLVMGLILASVFFNLRKSTDTFYFRGGALFFSVLFNAFSSLLEILSLYEARPIVEKHRKYALYRPSADALASIISELPVKLLMTMSFNIVYYFMVNLRRTTGNFFFYWLMCALCTLVMSHMFRSIGAVTTTIATAMSLSTVFLLAMIIYAGFVLPIPYILGWSKWIRYINPVTYIFESLMVNEFHGREFECGQYIPSGPGFENLPVENKVCTTVGSTPGSTVVQGTEYIKLAYQFYSSHKWRNFGITIGFAVFFLGVYVALTEFNKGAMQKGEIVLFLKGSLKKHKRKTAASNKGDIEAGPVAGKLDYQDEAEA